MAVSDPHLCGCGEAVITFRHRREKHTAEADPRPAGIYETAWLLIAGQPVPAHGAHPLAHHKHICPTPTPDRGPAMSQFETFVAPSIEDGDTYKPHEHIGAVVVVKARERKEGVVTANTPEGGPAVIVDLVDLKDGEKRSDVLWMGGAFVDALTPYVGKGPVVLEIESRTGKSGRAYAAPKAANDAQIKLAESYYAAKGDPFAQTFATVDTPAPATDAPAWAATDDSPPF